MMSSVFVLMFISSISAPFRDVFTFKSSLCSLSPFFLTNMLAGQKVGMCFVFVTFTGTEGNIDKGLVMGSRG